MIRQLTGRLIEAEPTGVVIDVAGVGYGVIVPMSTYDCLPRVGEVVTLLTHLAVREDAFTLYGFASAEERALFHLLTGVTGIGPRLALSVLSSMPASIFCAAVAEGDVKALSRINGIGKRSADRLVLELKDKVAAVSPDAAFAKGTEGGEWSREAQDAVAALATLGFKNDVARKAVRGLCEASGDTRPSAEELIRRALSLLNS